MAWARSSGNVSEGHPTDGQLNKRTQGSLSFLSIASLAYLLLTFVWNPDYGGRRDWDLFAPSAFVYTVLAAYLLIHQTRSEGKSPEGSRYTLAQAARLLIAASALHSVAWVYYNTIL